MRMTQERDESVKAEIANAIHQRQGQLNMLEALDATMDKAELQLENTLTALGTVYSQMLLIDARDVNSARTQRLRDNITEQMAGLNDVITPLHQASDRSTHSRRRNSLASPGDIVSGMDTAGVPRCAGVLEEP